MGVSFRPLHQADEKILYNRFLRTGRTGISVLVAEGTAEAVWSPPPPPPRERPRGRDHTARAVPSATRVLIRVRHVRRKRL